MAFVVIEGGAPFVNLPATRWKVTSDRLTRPQPNVPASALHSGFDEAIPTSDRHRACLDEKHGVTASLPPHGLAPRESSDLDERPSPATRETESYNPSPDPAPFDSTDSAIKIDSEIETPQAFPTGPEVGVGHEPMAAPTGDK